MNKKILSFLILVFQIQQISAQNLVKLTLVITHLPKLNSTANHLFLAGDLNQWNPNLPEFVFKNKEDQRPQLALFLAKGLINFKITRGDWKTVETDVQGNDRNNRILNLQNDTTVYLSIAGFADDFEPKVIAHSASASVSIIDTAFYIPQLHTRRRIWIYTPPNYQQTHQRFPVIYMQDGQNLFDKATSGYGEWGVDETLDSLAKVGLAQSIVIGIDHGGATRLTEYNPYDNERFGNGKGNEYVNFLAQTLKPYIDSHYRTLKDKKHTSIVGSSMGGLISMYAISKYPKVFGYAGVFSPSFWLTPNLYQQVKERNLKHVHIYFLAGEKESSDMVTDMKKMYDLLLAKGYAKHHFKLVTQPDGQHSEWFWHREFSDFYKWLIKK